MAGRAGWKLALMVATAVGVAGCEEGTRPFGFLGGEKDAVTETGATSTRLVERDVEAPQVFQVSEAGLWDGRPSLGGVWVAFPGVQDPERVIIRNPANGNFVIGALFRRERENPGPRLQVSSDAAAALGMLAGQPATLDVTALRREEVPAEAPAPETPILDTAETVETEALDPISQTASAAIIRAETAGTPTAVTPESATAAPAVPSSPQPAPSGRNLLQIGIFSVEANANRAAAQVRSAGAQASVKREESQGKTFWRVLAGPVATAADRDRLKLQMRDLGYADAYFVSR